MSEVIVSTSFLMCSDENLLGSIFCFPLNAINYYSSCSKIWLYGEILAWNFLSKLSSEYGCSDVRVSTSFLRVLMRTCLIPVVVSPEAISITLLVVQKFDYMDESWLVIWSQSDFQKMKFQRWKIFRVERVIDSFKDSLNSALRSLIVVTKSVCVT